MLCQSDIEREKEREIESKHTLMCVLLVCDDH